VDESETYKTPPRKKFHLESNMRETTLNDTMCRERLLSRVREAGKEVAEQKETF